MFLQWATVVRFNSQLSDDSSIISGNMNCTPTKMSNGRILQPRLGYIQILMPYLQGNKEIFTAESTANFCRYKKKDHNPKTLPP